MSKKSSSTNPYGTSAAREPEPTVEIDPNNVIVRFEDGIPSDERDRLRKEAKVTQFKTCPCGDKNLELWGVDTSVTNAEAVRGLADQDARSKGENHFYFPFPKIENFNPLDCDFSEDVCISGNDDTKVNIVVLDTGINLRYFNDAPFLYNTSGLEACPGHVGWNFRGEGSSNVFDDNGHGTYVTKIITDTLKAKGIGYRILPLKVLDREGKGSFWNVLCALSYLQKIQDEGANIHLVNASLGGTMKKELFKDSDILSTIINELSDEMLVIASAGNESTNTDSEGDVAKRHYPSSYKSFNILAVGGHSKDADGKLTVHSKSNYGRLSIDLAAPFEIEVAGLPVATLEGTSFSTAYVTALAAEVYKNYDGNPSPTLIKNELLYSAGKEPHLVDDKIAMNRAFIK